jgi:hypothetical protein
MLDITNVNHGQITSQFLYFFFTSKIITYYRRGDGDRLVRGETGDRRRERPLSRSLEY